MKPAGHISRAVSFCIFGGGLLDYCNKKNSSVIAAELLRRIFAEGSNAVIFVYLSDDFSHCRTACPAVFFDMRMFVS